MSVARLAVLSQVAAAARDARLAELSRLSAKIDRLRADIVALRSGAPAVSGMVPLAEALWATGRTARLRSMTTELARLMAEREVQVSLSRRAFGRASAAEKLLQRGKERGLRARSRGG